MDVKASSVIRVIIAGEWIWVEPGSFTVQDFVFVDDTGREINRTDEPAYHFVSTNGDPYYGPLSAIQLIKLRSPELDALTPESAGQPALDQPAQPAAAETSTGPSEPSADDAAKSAADGLFSDPIPMPSGETAEQSRGLL
jgi:hypothetical protein